MLLLCRVPRTFTGPGPGTRTLAGLNLIARIGVRPESHQEIVLNANV